MSETALFHDTVEKFHQYIMPTYAPKLMLVSGKGAYLTADDGTEYLDFAAGISVCNLGHCHQHVTEAIINQAQKLVHISNLYFNEVTPRLAEKLVKRGFDGKVFFCNSGAEANEGMIKFARKWGSDKGKYEIISMDNSFHGRTLATLAATGRSKYRKGFAPDMPGFKQVPFNDLEALKNAVTDHTCAILMEPVQGEGGILPANQEYLEAVRKLCNEKQMLLLFDEVQCGMGRTGFMFAWQGFGVKPDAFSMAKSIANGLPMGAFLVTREYADTLQAGEHASTFGGTPLVSAAALAVQEAFDQENILENCRKQGAYLMERLAEITRPYSFVKGVRGRGLMIGIVLDRPASALSAEILKQHMITLTAGETVLRLLPPLIITKKEADLAVERIAAGLKSYAESLAQTN